DAVICDLRRFYGVRLADMWARREKPLDVALYAHDCQYIEGSALNRAPLGADSGRNANNQLLAMLADPLEEASWFQRNDGQKTKNRRKQIPRPGVRDDKETTYGKGTVMTMAEARKWLGWE